MSKDKFNEQPVKTEIFQIETKNLIIESIEEQNQQLLGEIERIKVSND
jgi:hypothetical protein|tara:strand:+ start:1255 stop:1398 length:144 start_codon:yes stop_codon:yes gene_type:complete